MQHTIKVNYTDGNEITTRINGTADEISDFYCLNNIAAWEAGGAQAKRIEYVESDYLNGRSSYVYLFMDLQNSGLLQ